MNDFNIANMFIAAAQRWRDAVAIESPESALSHGRFIQLVMQMARHLRAQGVEASDHVGIALAGGPASVTAMVAIWVLGAVAVPLDFRSRTHERQRQAKALSMKFVLESRDLGDGGAYTGIAVRDDWVDVLAGYSSELMLPPPANHPAILSLTSGTSGAQQAMRLEHQTWYCRYTLHLLEPFYHPGVRFYNPIPMSFAASRNQSLARLLSGGTVIFSPPLYSADEIAEGIGATSANLTALVPTVLRELLELAKNEKRILFPNLDWLHCGGASISGEEKRLVRKNLCSNFLVRYGTSGTGNVSTQTGEEFDLFPESVGRPNDVVLVQIVDEENRPLPPGAVGTIRVRSPGNVTEILGSKAGRDGSAGDRIWDGWVYPGDIGSLNEQGYLTLHGRRSNMIIRGGANVYPAELEALLNAHPAVRDSAVVGQPSRSLGEEIVAFVVTDGSVTREELMAFCRSQFSPDKRPRDLFITDRLPRNANGKILHRELSATLPERD